MTFIPVVIFVVVFLVVVVLANAQEKKVNEAWTAAAAHLGLQRSPAVKRMEGRYEGHNVQVEAYSRGSGKSRRHYTDFRFVAPAPLPFALHLAPQGWLDSVTALFGAQDIATGDPAFDAAVLVKGQPEDVVRAWLSPERMAFLLSHRQGTWTIGSNGIVVTQDGTVSTLPAFVQGLRHVLTLAQLWGPAEDTGERRPTSSSSAPPPLPTRRAPELPVSESQEALTGEKEAAPDDTPADAGPEFDAGDRGREALFAHLFAKDMPYFKASKAFDESHKEREVTWTGTLAKVTSYHFDRVFGKGPGRIAVLEWPRAEGNVQAHFQLPDEVGEALQLREGQVIRLKGRMVKCDPFQPALFLDDGELG